ncbi:MAG TPA: PTS sugar transporter subunit IIA [bacterium (Candidatus Stahlbacteria)]|nr:PTS sugar transporter subunit IIA [Candidatus Stahlbacteria bacterium]
MNFSSLLLPDRINLSLRSKKKDSVIKELVGMVKSGKDAEVMVSTLIKREQLGSTGIGRGIAIPHCRSLLVDRLEIAIGRSVKGINFDAIDKKPVYMVFLVIAPPQDPGNQYLLTLGRIVQLSKELVKKKLFMEPNTPQEFIKLIARIEKVTDRRK